MNKDFRRLDRVKGCLLGGAIGDALGCPVEELTLDAINLKYGIDGISFPILTEKGNAITSYRYSLTLDIVKTIITNFSSRYFNDKKALLSQSISDMYRNIEKIHYVDNKNRELKILSKLAALGLLDNTDIDMCLVASYVAVSLNAHPLTFLSCQYYVLIIRNIMKQDGRSLWRITKDSLRDIKQHYDNEAPRGYEELFNLNKKHLPEFIEKMKKAHILIKYDLVEQEKNRTARDNTPLIIESLGGGYLCIEALAIALYAAVRFQSDPETALRKAVNHSGNSVATGTLAGQILGAYYGEKIIPPYLVSKLELTNEIEELSEDLARCTHLDSLSEKEKEAWKKKYL